MQHKNLRRIVSFLLTLVLFFATLPLNQVTAAEPSFQDQLEYLFFEHPREIDLAFGTASIPSMLYSMSLEVIQDQPAIAGYSVGDWVKAICKGADTLEKEWSYAAAEAFFLEYASHLDSSEQVEAFSDYYNTTITALSGMLDFVDILTEKDLEDIRKAVSEDPVIFKTLSENTLSASEQMVAFTNVTVTLIILYSCELSAMESLMGALQKADATNSGLYIGMQRVYDNLKNPKQYIVNTILKQMTESVAGSIVEAAISVATKNVFPLTQVISCVDCLLLATKEIVKFPEAKDLTKAIHHAAYYETVSGALAAIQTELRRNSEKGMKDEHLVETYELLFNARNELVIQCGKEAIKMNLGSEKKSNIETGIRLCESICTFETFVKRCYLRAYEKLGSTQQQGNYRYHTYVNENGKRFVCPYAGAMQYPGTTFTIQYSEWLEEPLDVDNGSYQYYVHTRTAECEKYGCIDPSWEGVRYIDEKGKTWFCPEVKDKSNCVHLWSNGKIKQSATCKDEGICLLICTLCGASMEETIPSTSHNYVENTCVNCGSHRGYIADRLAQLSEKLDGVYFTTTGKSCGNSNCDACAMKNVVKTERIAELFDGFVPAESVVISHDYGKNNPFTNGWSCCGFANFAGWYLFAENTKDTVDFNCICPDGKPVAFTEEGLKAVDVKPGDLLRLSKDPALGAKGHSAVFVDFTENGILILDCNMRLPGDGYCRIRTHELKYGEIYSYICVSRADNYDQIVEETPVEDGEFKTQYRYHMYVNENGKRFVCPYAGQLSYPGTTFEIQYTQWLDAPLTVDNGSYSHYIHTRTEQCEDYGCQDASWEGNRYRDGDGLTWACQETQKVPVEEKYQWGDANGDGEADYSDALAVLRFSIGLEELSSEAQKACDVDGNPGLNYNDALTILRRSIGLE